MPRGFPGVRNGGFGFLDQILGDGHTHPLVGSAVIYDAFFAAIPAFTENQRLQDDLYAVGRPQPRTVAGIRGTPALVIDRAGVAILDLHYVHFGDDSQALTRQGDGLRLQVVGRFLGGRQLATFFIDPLVLNGAFDGVRGFAKDALHPFVEEQAGTIDEFVDHARREIIRQIVLAGEFQGLRSHRSSHNDAGGVHARVRLSERGDDALTPPFRWSQEHEQNLVFVVVDNTGEIGPEPDQISRSQLTFEYRKLNVIAPPPHGLEHLAKAFVVRDVVADEVGTPHRETPGREPDSSGPNCPSPKWAP